MRTRTIIKRILLVIVLALLTYGIRYAWVSFPIISGFGAKNLCSCMFVGGRTEKSVKDDELADSPLNLGSFTVDEKDSSVTGTVAGLAKRKAVYRKGLGCTLVNGISEEELRKQSFVIAAPPAVNPDSVLWPMGDLVPRDTSVLKGVDVSKLVFTIERAFDEPDPKKKIGTRAILVVKDGKLLAERYANGYDKHSKMLGWSMSKSITGSLIGILVKQGRLQVDAPAPVPEWKDPADPRHAITLQNLLQQTSGLNYVEDYTKASTATNMLFKKGDMAAYVAGLPLKDKPGSLFYYSSGNSNILSRIIRQTVGEKDYHSFPATALFYKTGMYSTVPEPDASGTFVGSSYTYATARDWARFGLLYCNDGVWNGERILPEGWVKQASTPVVSKDGPQEYGYQLWLDKLNPEQPFRPGVPADVFYADGYGGQEVYIIPSKKLVVVRLGLHTCDMESLLENILSAIKE